MNHFAQNWLDIQCKLIPDCCSALLLMVKPDTTTIQPLAQWPLDTKEPLQLVTIAQLAVKNGGNVLNGNVLVSKSQKQGFDYFASPIVINKQLVGVIALKTNAQSEQSQRQIFDLLELGKPWLELSSTPSETERTKNFYSTIVSLVATCLEQNSYHEALIALITELAKEFQCERVTIGEIKRQHAEVIALSNSAKFDSRATLLRTIANAMDEAVDQNMIINYPPNGNLHPYISRAHQELARKYGTGSLCTIPFANQNSIFAVVTLERSEEQPFNPEAVQLLDLTMSLLGPYLQLKRAEEKSLFEKMGNGLTKALSEFFGYKHAGLKATGLGIIFLLTITSIVKGDFRIHADAVLEGKVQRVVAAPMQGFILTANARAGDTLKKGELMATMDDADLKLEAIKLTSQQQQTAREYREAMAKSDLVKVNVLNAQLEQVKAQLELINEQLQRTNIVAPFDGVVIEGDLSQSLGSPVERGNSLFKMAPLEGYRIILKVNERLIAFVQQGQTGTLALSSMPEQTFPLTVEKITAVSKAEDGSNIFRVEASLLDQSTLLRPGMAGIGKIHVGQKALLWIWTHEMMDWVKLWFWSWWP